MSSLVRVSELFATGKSLYIEFFVQLKIKAYIMKTILFLFSLLVIAGVSAASFYSYLNENYTWSAVSTVAWILGVSLLIGARGKEKTAK